MKRMFSIAGGVLGLLVLVGLAVVLAMILDALREGSATGISSLPMIETPTHKAHTGDTTAHHPTDYRSLRYLQ